MEHLLGCQECRDTLAFSQSLARYAAEPNIAPMPHAETEQSFLQGMAALCQGAKLVLLDLALTPFTVGGVRMLQPALRAGEARQFSNYTGKYQGLPAFVLKTRDNAPTTLIIEEPGAVVTFFERDKNFIASYDAQTKSIDITSQVHIIVFNDQYCFRLNETRTDIAAL